MIDLKGIHGISDSEVSITVSPVLVPAWGTDRPASFIVLTRFVLGWDEGIIRN